MTDISQMTDADLRLAIAKKLGMKVHVSVSGRFRYWLDISKGKQCAPRIRNWPGDNNAALGLLDEFGDWELEIERCGSKYQVILHVEGKDHMSRWCETLSRAISEAAYMAMKE